MSVQKSEERARALLACVKQFFTLVEWLTLTAAILYAAVKAQSLQLWLLAYAMQLALALYALFTFAFWIKPRAQSIQSRWIRWSVGFIAVAIVAFGGNWLIEDSVNRIVRSQLPDSLANAKCIPCRRTLADNL
jgi:hypothetical protein